MDFNDVMGRELFENIVMTGKVSSMSKEVMLDCLRWWHAGIL